MRSCKYVRYLKNKTKNIQKQSLQTTSKNETVDLTVIQTDGRTTERNYVKPVLGGIQL